MIRTLYCYSISSAETIRTQPVFVPSPLSKTLDHVVEALVCEDIIFRDYAIIADTSKDRSLLRLRLVAVSVQLTTWWQFLQYNVLERLTVREHSIC